MTTEITSHDDNRRRRKLAKSGLQLPPAIEAAGERARRKFVEFFLAQISNENTRKAYGRAVVQFFEWCEERGIGLRDVGPNVAAVYIRRHGGSDATVKQHLAALRKLCDWLQVEQVLTENPFSSSLALLTASHDRSHARPILSLPLRVRKLQPGDDH